MQLTQQIIDHFKFEEGYRTDSYLDTEGYWSVGVGHMLGKDPKYANITWTDAQIMNQFQADMDAAYTEICNIFSQYDSFSANVQLALLDMVYELGEHGLSEFHTMIADINAGNWFAASTDALNSKWAKQVPTRAQRDAALLAGG